MGVVGACASTVDCSGRAACLETIVSTLLRRPPTYIVGETCRDTFAGIFWEALALGDELRCFVVSYGLSEVHKPDLPVVNAAVAACAAAAAWELACFRSVVDVVVGCLTMRPPSATLRASFDQTYC